MRQTTHYSVSRSSFVSSSSTFVSHFPFKLLFFQSNHKNQTTAKQTHTHYRRTRQWCAHNFKLVALLLFKSNSAAPLSGSFSSNLTLNQQRTHIQSNSTALHLFQYNSKALLLFHSRSAMPPIIFWL